MRSLLQHTTRLLLLLILLAEIGSVASAQSYNISFRHLSTDEGLSQFSVNDIYIDETGNVWIGTREGLNRYNGNEVTTYKLQKDNPHSLFNNNVLYIDGDRNGHLFLCCTEGIAMFDIASQRFETLAHSSGFSGIHYYEGKLYAIRGRVISIFSKENRNFEPWRKLPLGYTATAVKFDSSGNMWVGSDNGLFRFAPDKDPDEAPEHVIGSGNIISIYEETSKELWIGTWDTGLYRIKSDGTVVNYTHDPKVPTSISSNFVRCCSEDNLGNIWIGTFNGLNCFNPRKEEFSNHTSQRDRPSSLSHSSIWCIVKDPQGTIWTGTYFGGVNYFNPEFEIYNYYRQASSPDKGLSSSVIGRIIEDNDEKLWICTEGGGVNVLDPKRKNLRWITEDGSRNSLRGQNVKAIYYDEALHVVWIGTHLGGLNRLDLNTNRFRNYRMREGDPNSLPSDIVRDIVPHGNELIIATQNGVCRFNPATERFVRMFGDTPEGEVIKMVADLHTDRNGRLWMAVTGEGVFRYDFVSGELVNYRFETGVAGSLSINSINSITEDSKGRLWFASSGTGLDLYCPESDNFRNFDSRHYGIQSDCIYKVCESTTGEYLFFTTNKGLTIMDIARETFINYGKDNGFPLTATNENSLCVTRSGMVFMGGVDGMISFHEADLDFPPKQFDINLAKLRVNGSEVTVEDSRGILEKAICFTDHITLKPHQTMFGVEFSTSNFIPANKEEIVYRLKGFSDEWISARNDRQITYTNLNPGTYRLEIKSTATNYLVEERTLTITVLPPFYKTRLAYMIYALALAALLWFVIVSYKSRIRLQESLKYEQLRRRDIEELNQSKLRFFTSISHEFRTPLTLIIGHVEAVLQGQSFTPAAYNKILGIYRNSLLMKDLISELLDFRKHEQGMMKIKARKHNLIDFLNENYLLFREYALNKQINFTFEKESDDIVVWYDMRQMQKVVNNILSNAIKHTPEGGMIALSVKRDGEEVVVEVTDTGTGIRQEEIDNIFDRFYQTSDSERSAQPGSGIGLALTKGIVELHHGTISVHSEYGKGCTFTIHLKQGRDHFSDEEADLSDDRTEQVVATNTSLPELSEEMVGADNVLIARKGEGAPKILIVEDNAPLRSMLCEVFVNYYSVNWATDGMEALEKIEEDMPDIVLSDVLMPRITGVELCRRIKSDQETCHIPVILLTARTAVEHNLEGLRSGADDYITKPFNINLLVSRCNNLINSRLLLQEKFSRQPQASARMLATNPMDKAVLDKAMEVIERHLDQPEFNVNTFAREMGMARTNLFAKLKAITGQTPNDFIQTIRLKKGALMLRNNPEMNVSEIADRAGFSSSRYFGKCFKEAYGMTPLAYRNNGVNNEEDAGQ